MTTPVIPENAGTQRPHAPQEPTMTHQFATPDVANETEAAEARAYARGLIEGERRGHIAGQALSLTRARTAIDKLLVVKAGSTSEAVVNTAAAMAATRVNTPCICIQLRHQQWRANCPGGCSPQHRKPVDDWLAKANGSNA